MIGDIGKCSNDHTIMDLTPRILLWLAMGYGVQESYGYRVGGREIPWGGSRKKMNESERPRWA
jgi:hypothetical protein